MIVTSIATVKNTPTLSLHPETVKLDFGSLLIEIDIEGFKDLIAALVMQGAAQGINFSTNKKGRA
jgi:hypothetical protein